MKDVDGHNVQELRAAPAACPPSPALHRDHLPHREGQKGVFAENMEWHHQNKVTAADVDRLIAALEGR